MVDAFVSPLYVWAIWGQTSATPALKHFGKRRPPDRVTLRMEDDVSLDVKRSKQCRQRECLV